METWLCWADEGQAQVLTRMTSRPQVMYKMTAAFVQSAEKRWYDCGQ